MRCLKRCHSMQDPVQANICMLSYEMVSKKCLKYRNSIRIYNIAKYGPLKCMFKLHFQIWTLPDIKLIFEHYLKASVIIFILKVVKTSHNLKSRAQ